MADTLTPTKTEAPSGQAAHAVDPFAGRVLSHYRLEERLGGGGMGVVYRATDLKLGRSVAIKLLARHLVSEEIAKARFVLEARAASALDHPNIGTLHDIGEQDGELFIVMALYEGETLNKRLEKGPLPVEEALGIFRELALGVEAAHRAGIVHRDLKPANVLVTTAGTAKILDFGLAKLVSETTGQSTTQAGQVIGTILYMAPEQLRGEPVDHRSDLWSLGALTYELLTGVSPFQADSSAATAMRILNDEPPSLASVPGIPGWLAELVARLLRKAPSERPQSASEILGRLEDPISHYRLLELIWRGPMSEVWLAEDTQLPRKVVVKLLPPHLGQDDEAVSRLMREAQAAASVEHPAVVMVYEAGLAKRRPYLVMQRVEGETLEERLRRGPLPVGEAIELAKKLVDALAEVHALGIVHRDLKPSNIMMSPRGPKILDFGVASLKGSPQLTVAGTSISPLTLSPEQVEGLSVDNRSDLWAIGVVLYEMLTGKFPFPGETPALMANSVLTVEPPPPKSLRPEVGADLDYLVMKLLRKNPAHRYAKAEEVLSDLAICGLPRGKPRALKPTVPRVAVMYFEVLSPDPEDAFLGAGLTDDLIVDLTRVGGLRLASREDVRVYRERPVPPRTLARELGVDFVLLGSVRRAGSRVRIAAQLVRGSDGHTLWAERFDRTLEDLFEVQAEVSKRIVEALQVALKPGELEMLERAPTSSAEAYTFYLKARELLDRGGQGDRNDNLRAEQLLKEALALDPQFALGHATLGDCYARRGLRWWAGMEVAEPAMSCARRALQIEPDLFEAKLVRAMVLLLTGDRDVEVALEEALAIAPDHSQALEWAAFAYMSLGKPQQALGILEPLSERHPDRYVIRMWLSACYEMLGRREDLRRANHQFVESVLEFVRRHPDDSLARARLAGALVAVGRVEAGTAEAARAVALAPDDGLIRYNAACAFARSKMLDRALTELKESIRNLPSYFAEWPKRDPDFAALRDHPEFIRLFGRAVTIRS